MIAKKTSKLKFLTTLAASMTLVSAASAAAYFYQTPGSVGGLRPGQIGAKWEQWALGQPSATNPITDTTGKNCAVHQPAYTGNPVTNIWWLAGTQGGSVTRSCNVPLTRTVVFPIVNGSYIASPGENPTDAQLNSYIAYVKNSTNLSVTFDGVALTNPASYYVVSDDYSVKLPNDNILGAPAGTYSPAKDAGFYVGVTLYTPGKHVLKFKGTVNVPQTNEDGSPKIDPATGKQVTAPTTVDVTYNLNVGFTPFG